MSERGNRDGSVRRSSFRKSLSDASLPPHYLAQLEEKRKQLDESIHKYIAAKEREYKQFEKELRQQHRSEQGGDTSNGTSRRRSSPESSPGDGHATSTEIFNSSAVDALQGSSTRRDPDGHGVEFDDVVPGLQDPSFIAGLKDRRTSFEREKDFIGVFTPPFLPALGYRDGEAGKLERTSSAPEAVQLSKGADPQDKAGPLERANSDSMMQAKPRRPSQLALTQRTSSSGSSADGKLTSAMKSAERPKRKQRVSLAVGDEIVAPSDSVPVSLSHNSSSSHSRIRSTASDHEFPISLKQSTNSLEARSASIDSSLGIAEGVALANAIGANRVELPDRLSAVRTTTEPSNLTLPSSTSNLDADGDLFDLDEEEAEINAAAKGTTYLLEDGEEADEDAIESGDEVAGRVDGKEVPEALEPDTLVERYDPTTGLVPEPTDGTDAAAPYLAFGPVSPVASQQPTQPGFRRPSVVYDPIYRGIKYGAAERDAVENEVYGSSFNRPSSKGSFQAGSLGESYMQQHAEEMMKLRRSRPHAQVKS